MKKSRSGKKRNPLKALRPALDNVVLYSAHCFDEMQVIGIKTPSVHKAIFNMQHKWNIMLLTFCIDANGHEYADVRVPDLPISNSKTAQELCDPISAQMIAKLNPKQFICSGWYATLTDKFDLMAHRELIIDLFRQGGAFDREVCNLAWSLRPESEK